MAKKRKIIKGLLITICSLIIGFVGFVFWFVSLITPENRSDMISALPTDLQYLTYDSIANRGKILAIVTSVDKIGESDEETGYELTELSRAYYVFTANGFEVDIASPRGGKAPVILDDDDSGIYDYAFLNDTIAKLKIENTLPISQVIQDDYQAVYFVGGKGAMFDFPENESIQSIIKEYSESNKVIGAVCHGPAALINVTLTNGKPILHGRKVSGFTNEEELFLIPDASDKFPFMLQDKLVERGANFNEGTMYLKNVVVDGNLITGQNPWSTWALAESMVKQLGYQPKSRNRTSEEISIEILETFQQSGYEATTHLADRLLEEDQPINRELIATHSILSIMQWDFIKAGKIIRLLSYLKNK